MPPPNLLSMMPPQIPTSIPGGMPLASTTNAGNRDRNDIDQVCFLFVYITFDMVCFFFLLKKCKEVGLHYRKYNLLPRILQAKIE